MHVLSPTAAKCQGPLLTASSAYVSHPHLSNSRPTGIRSKIERKHATTASCMLQKSLLLICAIPTGLRSPVLTAASTAAAANANVSMLSPAASADAPTTLASRGLLPAVLAVTCAASAYARPRTCTTQPCTLDQPAISGRAELAHVPGPHKLKLGATD